MRCSLANLLSLPFSKNMQTTNSCLAANGIWKAILPFVLFVCTAHWCRVGGGGGLQAVREPGLPEAGDGRRTWSRLGEALEEGPTAQG